MIQPGRTVYDEHGDLVRVATGQNLAQFVAPATIQGRAWSVASPGLLGPMTARPLKVES